MTGAAKDLGRAALSACNVEKGHANRSGPDQSNEEFHVTHLDHRSADGLGLIAAQLLISQGHEVVLHARNQVRVADPRAAAPGAAGVLAGDLSSIDQMGSVARQANDSGRFDTVIHNAGVGYRKPHKVTTADGLSHVFAINVLAHAETRARPGAGDPAR
jgi:hypothetical protein